jgi:hypothetical protein
MLMMLFVKRQLFMLVTSYEEKIYNINAYIFFPGFNNRAAGHVSSLQDDGNKIIERM